MQNISKIVLDYTNRRKVVKLSSDNKSNEEWKMENEQDFESVCSQIQECSISKISVTHKQVNRKSHSAPTSTLSSCRNHPEVEEFHRYLNENGGHYGGWKVKDHLFFIKTRSKHPLKETATIVSESFPDINSEKVLAHDTWYNEYLKLRDANKKAIEKWKKTHKPPEKSAEKPKEETKPLSAPIKRDPNLKEKIEIWKAHSLAAKLKRLEDQEEEEARKKKEEEKRKQLQGERKALVNRYREDKLGFEMAMKAAREAEMMQAKRESVHHSAQLLKYFRYEDRRFTDRQRAKKQQLRKKEPVRMSCVEAKRDPGRLLQPTLGWIYHTKKTEDITSSSHSAPPSIQHVHKLGKPAWRKGVTT